MEGQLKVHVLPVFSTLHPSMVQAAHSCNLSRCVLQFVHEHYTGLPRNDIADIKEAIWSTAW